MSHFFICWSFSDCHYKTVNFLENEKILKQEDKLLIIEQLISTIEQLKNKITI